MHLFLKHALHTRQCYVGSRDSDALATIVQLLYHPSPLRRFIHRLLIAGTQDAASQVPLQQEHTQPMCRAL